MIGVPLVVHNRSRAAVDQLVSAGAQEARSPREVAQRSTVMVTMLPNSPDVTLVAKGEDGLFAGASAGDIIIDSSTISPVVTSDLAEEEALAVDWRDAPVSGGPQGAEAGTLSIMVGGPATALETAHPVLEAMGTTITHVGEESGSGQVAKACNQVAGALTLQAVCEALLLAKGAGVDPHKVHQAIRGGAAGSWMMDKYGPLILAGDHTPGFKAWLHLKDIRIALETATHNNLPLPGTALVAQLFASLVSSGGSDSNTSALYTVLERLGSIEDGGTGT